KLRRFIATEVRRTLDQVKIMSPERILSEVRHERLFGCVEVDIRVGNSGYGKTITNQLKHRNVEYCSLFKVEWEGQGIVGLCSKTYYCFGAKDKFSCKGVNKKCNDINKDKYLNVLLTKQNSAGVNRGFRVVNNTMYTYTQVRDAFSYFYPKRKVLADGVSTTPLDI
ncbi:unnamed protein product, partial [Porites lobata]